MAETKEKPKGPIGKLKEAIEDKEEQLAILSTFVRLGILVLSLIHISSPRDRTSSRMPSSA